MKRKGLLVVLLAVFGLCFATAEGSYTVKAVKGTVQYEVSPGTWKAVTVGQSVSDSTVIKTAVNSKLTLAGENGEVEVKAMQKGAVAQLASAGSKAKVTKGSAAVKGDVKGSATAGKQGVSTASSRASEAKEDVEWDE